GPPCHRLREYIRHSFVTGRQNEKLRLSQREVQRTREPWKNYESGKTKIARHFTKRSTLRPVAEYCQSPTGSTRRDLRERPQQQVETFLLRESTCSHHDFVMATSLDCSLRRWVG